MAGKARDVQPDGSGGTAAAGHPSADEVLGAKPLQPVGPLQWLKAQLRWLAVKAVGAVMGLPLGLKLLISLVTR